MFSQTYVQQGLCLRGCIMKNLFITGYDSNTVWMLDWFLKNFNENSDTPILTYDFDDFSAPVQNAKNWFKKPFAMLDAVSKVDKVCWLDIDMHIKQNIDGIFDHVEPNKLAMVEDVPWSRRRGQKWHNSGVVAFQGKPQILRDWASEIALNPIVGDQEVLHSMLKSPLKRMIHITDLPREYNTLRIDFIDGTNPNNPKIVHWTGAKGKEEIKKMMLSGMIK